MNRREGLMQSRFFRVRCILILLQRMLVVLLFCGDIAAFAQYAEDKAVVEFASAETFPVAINASRVMNDIRYLSGELGPRKAGTRAETLAGDHIAEKMKRAGCRVSFQRVRLPNGTWSRNIIGVIGGAPGARKKVIIGAHYDSRQWTPGANDNASGAALLMELARLVPARTLNFNLVLIAFGAEEILPGTGGRHHFGSNQFVAERSRDELADMIAMLSLDMVGAGSRLQIGNCGSRDRRVIGQLRQIARQDGVPTAYFGTCGSDNAAFERKGVPVAHVRWYPDANYHKPSDTADKISTNKLKISGRMTLKWLKLTSDRS